MYGVKLAAGGVLFLYAIVYAAQALFSRFYADALDPQEIWDVFNYITGAGILIAIAVAWGNKRVIAHDDLMRRLTAQATVFVSLALAIIFFPLWFSLIMGDTQSDAQNVGWILVSVLNPLVLANAGACLWHTSKPE